MQEKVESLKKTIPGAVNYLMLIPRVARLLLALFRDPRVPRFLKVLTAGVAVYIALPFDVLPDFVPVVGKGDDLVALLLVLVQYMRWCPPEVVAEHWGRIMDGGLDARAELEKAMEEMEPLLGRRFDYLRENVEQILKKLDEMKGNSVVEDEKPVGRLEAAGGGN